MSDTLVICPWIVPKAPAELLSLFEDAAPQTCRARSCLQSDAHETGLIRRVDTGILSQGVTNHRLNKPVAMNLYPAGTLPGFLNVFTGVPSPRLLNAVETSRFVELPQVVFREQLTADRDLLVRYAEYAELAQKSELIGMEALFSLGLLERALLWFASCLLYHGVNPQETKDDYLRLPFTITRPALCNVIYTSKAPLDRLYAEIHRDGTLVVQSGERFVRRERLELVTEWILTH